MMLARFFRRTAAPSARVEPMIYSRAQPPASVWIRPSVEEAASLRWRIIDLENSLKAARRQVIVAEFAAKVDKTQIKQLEALLARRQKNNVKEIE
jgi:hypothetical protein